MLRKTAFNFIFLLGPNEATRSNRYSSLLYVMQMQTNRRLQKHFDQRRQSSLISCPDSYTETILSLLTSKESPPTRMGSAEKMEVDKNSKMWRTALEVLEPETVAIEGKLPNWLTGTYYRVGPGKFDFGDNYSLRHWLDGYALISKFDIDGPGQSVSFQSKYLRTDTYERALKLDRPAVAEFATPATSSVDNKKGFFSRLIPQIVRLAKA